MKLGLLLVLAVAIVLPSLSESRIVSKCELKRKLEKAIQLPKDLQKMKDKIISRGEVKKYAIAALLTPGKSKYGQISRMLASTFLNFKS